MSPGRTNAFRSLDADLLELDFREQPSHAQLGATPGCEVDRACRAERVQVAAQDLPAGAVTFNLRPAAKPLVGADERHVPALRRPEAEAPGHRGWVQ